MSDRIVTLLQDAARGAEFPETPPLAETVRARIETGPLPVATVRLPRTRPRVLRPALVVLSVVALAMGLTLSLSVTARRAVADLLGVVGIRVTFDEDPAVTPVPPERIDLGVPVSKAVAGERAGFRVRTPKVPGAAPAFYFEASVGDGMVSIVYPRDAASLADADLLVTEFAASLREELVKKIGLQGAEIRYVRVRSRDGYWIGGAPHLFFYEDRNGDVRQETVRLAGDVLLWEEAGVTYRIEGAGSLAEAKRLASSLR